MIKKLSIIFFFGLLLNTTAQQISNCFLENSELKYAEIPPFISKEKPEGNPSVTITVNVADTLGRISKYIFGNALAAWIGNDPINDPVFVRQVQMLSPTLIRYPGGSWSDIFFWDGKAENIPPTVWDGNQNKWINFTPQFGKNSWPTTVDNYYRILDEVATDGLITINYSYARYGTGEDPVAQAAHYAAQWVRYDDGRTKFWEIGNENGGPWEAGWRIDTSLNKDGQPEIITGELYGKHFKVFADSMRKAAAERDNKIYIGAQILHFDGTNSWNVADRKWNEGVFKEIGDAADFYVIHNYFGKNSNAKSLLDIASQVPKQMMDFIKLDITKKNAYLKPVAITEWNMDQSGSDLGKTSIINGMQAVILFNEFIKLNYSMSCRWLLANWESDGMFYRGNNTSIPKWNPRPDFYYIYYLQKFTGDHSVNASVTGNSDLLAYATIFSSGHLGLTVINKSKSDLLAEIKPLNFGFGDYYIYSLTGGTDNPDFSQYVFINQFEPTGKAWGPLENLETIPAFAYNSNGGIKFNSPARSVQFILIEPGINVSIKETEKNLLNRETQLFQNYPNPFNPQTIISYRLSTINYVTIKVYDILGREIKTLVNGVKHPGKYDVIFDGSKLSAGVYYYRIQAGNFSDTKKMLLIE
ncbi:T9SS type A sorting domain-containing protein [Rosettibacter firmus]|uniref:T9SS type A sorting domain-containing protein n=1 Tax=Rosettibacter firmus TaxID=3111522 RepID=UPI00336C0ECB